LKVERDCGDCICRFNVARNLLDDAEEPWDL